MTMRDIEQVLKESALDNGAFLNSNGNAYLFESSTGKLHAVADTDLDKNENPKLRYRRIWDSCRGRAYDSKTVTGFGWVGKDDLEWLDNICKNCQAKLETALTEETS